MFDLILASLLLHSAAGIGLLLFAAGSATAEMLRSRQASTRTPVLSGIANVVELPAPRVPKAAADMEMEGRAEAA